MNSSRKIVSLISLRFIAMLWGPFFLAIFQTGRPSLICLLDLHVGYTYVDAGNVDIRHLFKS